MGRLVGLMPPESISAALEVLDDRSLLQTAFVLESKDGLRELVSLLPPERIDGIIDAAASGGLWPEALDLVANLDSEQRAEFAHHTGGRGPEALDSLLSSVDELGLWKELRPLESELPPAARARVRAARAAAGA